MTSLALILMLLQPSDQEDLDRQIRRLEEHVDGLGDQIRSAMKSGDPEAVERLDARQEEAAAELELLRRRQERRAQENLPSSGFLDPFDDAFGLHLEAAAVWLRFKDKLGIDDAVGYSVRLAGSFPDGLQVALTFRGFAPDHEGAGDDVDVLTATLGVLYHIGLDTDGRFTLRPGIHVGMVSFSDEPHKDERGELVSAEVGVSWSPTQLVRIHLGVNAEYMHTGFHMKSRRWLANYGGSLSLEFGF